MIAARCHRSDCSRLGNFTPRQTPSLRFKRPACTRYITPKTNPKHVDTAPNTKKIPCAAPQNVNTFDQSARALVRGAHKPATVNTATASPSTAAPATDGRPGSARTTKYNAIAANTHPIANNDSNDVVTGNDPTSRPRFAKYAVCTNNPNPINTAVNQPHHRPRNPGTNRSNSLPSARAYVPPKQTTVSRSITTPPTRPNHPPDQPAPPTPQPLTSTPRALPPF